MCRSMMPCASIQQYAQLTLRREPPLPALRNTGIYPLACSATGFFFAALGRPTLLRLDNSTEELWKRSGCVATDCASAAGTDVGGWVHGQRVSRDSRAGRLLAHPAEDGRGASRAVGSN